MVRAGRGRSKPAEMRAVNKVDGVQVGFFPDSYATLAGNPPDQVIILQFLQS